MDFLRRGSNGVALVSGYALLALLFLVTAYMGICDAASVFDVYRAIQYDLRGIPMGSRRSSINHHACSGLNVSGSDLTRTVVILPVSKVNITLLNGFIQSKRLLGGLILLLPEKFGSSNDEGESDSDQIQEIERWIINTNIPYPVYFVNENEKLKAVLEEVTQNDNAGKPATATTGGYKFVVAVPEPRKIVSPTVTNIQAWLPGKKSGDSVLPTIAIVAWYDTFGAAPALSKGSDSNGSGVVVLLEIVRLFSRLYADPKTRGRYNLLFGLTSGGPYNYDGTSKWLKSFDQRLRESIDYAICLNTVGSSSDDKLWMHVSKPPENAFIKQIHEGLTDVAKDLGFSIEIKHKKINISNPRVAWEHEQFSRHRITSATLSGIDTAPQLLQSTGGLSDIGRVNKTQVLETTKLVAESIGRYVYGLNKRKGVTVFEDGSSLAVDASYLNQWLDFVDRTDRVAPFVPKTSLFITALHQELREHIEDVRMQHESMDDTFVFYDVVKAQLSVYQVASVTFDLVIMLGVGSYLGLLFIILVVSTKGLDDLIRRPPSRKLKSP